MFTHETKIRVRYAETDQMDYVYYGNYATYFEVARVDFMKSLGINYKDLEDSGIMMPVLYYSTKYYKPALYDNELNVRTIVKELPVTRICFFFEVFNQERIKLNDAEVTLAFVNVETKKPCPAPQTLINQLKKYF